MVKLEALKAKLKGRVVILCLGNSERGDDGVGPEVAKRLSKVKDYIIIDGGMVPENFLEPIIKLKPDVLVVIDAVRFEGAPGEIKVFKANDLISGRVSTHDMSPRLFIEYLKDSIKLEIYIIGVQPKISSFGSKMSKEVIGAIERIVKSLKYPIFPLDNIPTIKYTL